MSINARIDDLSLRWFGGEKLSRSEVYELLNLLHAHYRETRKDAT